MEYVGRISFKHLKDEAEDLEAHAAALCLAFCCETGVAEPLFVFEVGDCGEPHGHFYFESVKAEATLRRLLQKHFRLPLKVRMPCESKEHTYMLCFHFFHSFHLPFLRAVLLSEEGRPLEAPGLLYLLG